MKKYITLAALLAAGTACANAETKLTLSTPTDGSLESGNQYISWQTPEGATAADYEILESWSLSFKIQDTVADDGAVFSTTKQGGGGATGYVLKTKADGSVVLCEDGPNGTEILSIEDVLSVGVKSDFITLSFVADISNGSFDGGTFSLSYGSSTVSEHVEGLSNREEVLNGATSLINGEIPLKTGENEGNQNWSSRFWTNSADEKIYEISLKKLDNNIVPEPSAFGMLAGLGALALVASRRRRK